MPQTVAMNSTLRKLQSFGCSLKGFQAILRRGDENYWQENNFSSDCDWSSFYHPCLPDDWLDESGELALYRTHINLFPDEILVKIFSYLSARDVAKSISPVCKYWYKLAKDPTLWKRLEFSFHTNSSHLVMVKVVSKKHDLLRSITLKNFKSTEQMERMLFHVGNNCSRLREINLYNCSVRSETLTRLGKEKKTWCHWKQVLLIERVKTPCYVICQGMTCPNVTSLSLIFCDENYRKHHHFIRAYMRSAGFVASFSKLTSLVLFSSLSTLSYDDADNIVKTCKNLKRLVLNCDFYGRAIRHVLSSLSATLEVLWLQGRNYNDSMCQEISKCKRLRELGLRHVENITPTGLHFLSKLTKLEKLLLFYANNITPKNFAEFFMSSNAKNLNYVNLSGCKGIDHYMERIIRINCPRIREIILDPQPYRTAGLDFWDFGDSLSIEMFTGGKSKETK